MNNDGVKKPKPNSLINEKSPYLLQHAFNPVNWRPWGDEAFEEARRENKLIFLSIGYSTCHWCHVMAHESFEDEHVAELMNDAFVCVKVDREERPDIDKVYMKACQILTGGGGWPLTIVMTYDKRPVYADTYIPKESRFGKTGMIELIPGIMDIWKKRRADVLKTADSIVSLIKTSSTEGAKGEITKEILDETFEDLKCRFDDEYGGFTPSPKFPMPHQLFFLLRFWKWTGKKEALDMVTKTLHAMRLGGIYDHIGFGFHRYSTDEKWLVPHFEKMLYDQALLAIAYTEAYQATHDVNFMQTACEIFEYVLRDMKAQDGGFFSAEDADSEGEEGRFYLWTCDELEKAIGQEKVEIIARVFKMDKDGNFFDEIKRKKTGRNILHTDKTPSEHALFWGMAEDKYRCYFDEARQRLFDIRKKRIHPHKDDKILTDWNGLMIAALARGFQVFSKPGYKEAAEAAVSFILGNMTDPDGRLLHRYREGEAAIMGNLDDYAFLIWGLLECYEAFFDVNYLLSALKLQDDLNRRFWDKERGGYYFTPEDGEDLITRQKEAYDGPIPSGNSVSMLNLIGLSRMTGNHEYESCAFDISRVFADAVRQMPAGYAHLMVAQGFLNNPSYEIIITASRRADDMESMLREIRRSFIPNKVVIFRPADEELPDIATVAPFVKNMQPLHGKATVYVCSNFSCQRPATDINEMRQMLNETPEPKSKRERVKIRKK